MNLIKLTTFAILTAIIAPLSSGATVNLSTQVFWGGGCMDSHIVAPVGTAPSVSQCGVSLVNSIGTITDFVGTSKAAASLGQAESFSQLMITNVQPLGLGAGIIITSLAGFADHITNTSAIPLTLNMTLEISGTTTPTDDPQFTGQVTASATGCAAVTITPTNPCRASFLVAPSRTLNFVMTLQTGILYTGSPFGGPPVTGGNFTGTVDYYGSSLDITAFSATDLAGNPVSLDLFSSDSGVPLSETGYATAAAIPEPSTLILCVFGLVCLAGCRCTRRLQ